MVQVLDFRIFMIYEVKMVASEDVKICVAKQKMVQTSKQQAVLGLESWQAAGGEQLVSSRGTP